MRHPSARHWPRLAVLTLSLSLVGCGPALPPAQTPEAPTAPKSEPRPVRDSGAIPRAFTSGGPTSPFDMRSQAPAPEAQPQGNLLTQPDQPSLSLGDLQGGLPPQIPQGMAGSLLRPLDQGPIAGIRAPGPGLGDGCAYGALPDLVDYGVYPHLLYYPFRSIWVPYILVDDCYYPYVYQPYFDPLYTGYCYYPLFLFRHGYYYPYYFRSRSYFYGYLDWEYNWPRYREHHADYDWSDIGRRHLRRYNQDDFEQWRDGRIRGRDRTEWQRVEPPRKQRPDAEQGLPPERPRERGGSRDGGAASEARPQRPERITERPGGPKERGPEGRDGSRGKKAGRLDRTVEGDERTHSKAPKERAEAGPPAERQKEGRKGRADRRLQADPQDEQEPLD